MAPNTSGVGYADAYRSYELAQCAYEICQSVLKDGGNFIVKVFPGKENNELRANLKKSFRYVTTVVPPATRKTSSEQYFVAGGFRGTKSDLSRQRTHTLQAIALGLLVTLHGSNIVEVIVVDKRCDLAAACYERFIAVGDEAGLHTH